MTIIVVVPTLSPLMTAVTYGRLEMGEVPSSALMDSATPKAITASPASSRASLAANRLRES